MPRAARRATAGSATVARPTRRARGARATRSASEGRFPRSRPRGTGEPKRRAQSIAASFIYLLGRAATPGAAETRQFLSRNRVAFRWVDVDDNPVALLRSAERELSHVRSAPPLVRLDAVDEVARHAAVERV